MGRRILQKGFRKERAPHNAAIALLLVIGGFALAGPTGLLAWSENLRLLDKRAAHLEVLNKERAALANRVELLNPDAVDPDLAAELLRSELNVVHPHEVVVELED